MGRKSLGSAPKRLVRDWLDARDSAALFKANVGQDPSLTDIVKMVHPKPKDAAREALFGYFIGREHARDALPEVVRTFEAFKQGEAGRRGSIPDVPFQMLTAGAWDCGMDCDRAPSAVADDAHEPEHRVTIENFIKDSIRQSPIAPRQMT